MYACSRFFGHPPQPVRARLQELAQQAADDDLPDRYGTGPLIESFEAEIAQLLGKEAAVFMPSGTMAQQIALRIHTDRRACRAVALHAQSHLLVSENGAMQNLHRLAPIPAGDRNAPYTRADLEALPVTERIGAIVLELPERNLGGVLRDWVDVEEICGWARENGIAAHMDGARLWESQPHYAKPLPELCAPFDTVYVSFYKILNAIAGAALAGPQDVIDDARAWQWRHGGRLVQQYPTIVSAREGLRRYLPRIPEYCRRAREIASVLSSFEWTKVTPDPPHTNMMHVYVPADRERLAAAALKVSGETGVWMPAGWTSTEIPGWSMFELTCAEGSLAIADGEVHDLFSRLFEIASA